MGLFGICHLKIEYCLIYVICNLNFKKHGT